MWTLTSPEKSPAIPALLLISISVLSILILILNELWQRGLHTQVLNAWSKYLLALIMIQCQLIFSFQIHNKPLQQIGDLTLLASTISSSSFQQIRARYADKVLPGGIVQRDIDGLKIVDLDLENNVKGNTLQETEVIEIVEANPLEEDESDLTQDVALYIVGKPLNYPNPARLGVEGTTIGYQLSKPATIQLRIYDPRAHEIYRKEFASGSNGGKGGFTGDVDTYYNRIPISSAELGTDQLSAGIYFYVLMSGNSVLGKGKIAAIP